MLGLSATGYASQAPDQRGSFNAPVAKTQQEVNDYNSAFAAKGAVLAEKAAVNFEKKYPESQLRQYLYAKAMNDYQRENNGNGMLSMGQRVLLLNPGHPGALVLTALATADTLKISDRDRERKVADIKNNCNHALRQLDRSYSAPAGSTPAQAALYKSTLQAMAYAALGVMKLKLGDSSGAEKDLKAAAGFPKSQPDPYIWYHLAIAQDYQHKYAAALASVEQALQLASANPDLQRLSEAEHLRLTKQAANSPSNVPELSPP